MDADDDEPNRTDLRTVGAYRLERELRRGGMGVIYLAHRSDNPETVVAIKMASRCDVETEARFRQEIAATRSLDYPGVVRILDTGRHSGRPWYAMNFAGHANLADVLAVRGAGAPDDLGSLIAGISTGRLQPLPLEQRIGLATTTAIALMQRIARIVAHAHSRGVLHRDLKPANILLTEHGDPVLADFGVAQNLFSNLRLTADNEVVGSLTYIAPEQLSGADCDERADVYALGAMLHECLVGRPPERRLSGCEALELPDNLPRPLRRILSHALEPRPRDRMRNATALASDLARYQRGEKIQARAASLPRRLTHHVSRHPLIAALLCAMLVVAALTVFVSYDILRQQRAVWRSPSIDLYTALIPEVALHASGHEGFVELEGNAQSVRTRTLEGGFIALDDGQGITVDSSLRYQGHHVLAVHTPTAAGLRVEARARAPLEHPGEISVFLGGSTSWQQGYTFQLGAYENSCALLKRAGRTLWMGPGVITPGASYAVGLERIGDRIRASVDGVTVVEVRDLLPLDGRLAGCFTYHTPGVIAPPIFQRLRVAEADLPDLAPPEWLAVRLALTGKRTPAPAGTQILDRARAVSDDMLARLDPADARFREHLLRRGALLDTRDTAARQRHIRVLHDHAAELDHRAVYHRQLIEGSGLSPEDPALVPYIRGARAAIREPDERARFACWVERDLRGHARLAALELLLPEIDPLSPLSHFLRRQLATAHAETAGNWDRSKALLEELQARSRETYWVRLARRTLAFWHFRRRDFTAMDRSAVLAAIDRFSGGLPHLRQQAFQVQLCLGGYWSLPGIELAEPVRSMRDALLQMLRGEALQQDTLGRVDLADPLSLEREQTRKAGEAALLAGELPPALIPVLEMADRPSPRTPADLRRDYPWLLGATGDSALPLEFIRERLLAGLLAADPNNELLRTACWHACKQGQPGELHLALPLLAHEARIPQRLLDHSQGWVREALRELFLNPVDSGRTQPDLDRSLGRLLALMLARRDLDTGALSQAHERLTRLAATGPAYPCARIARRMLAERAP
ncbi:MAG: protein kinase domain-containing protein [Planctomycetota bacterium]